MSFRLSQPQKDWLQMFQKTLPAAAKLKSPAQRHWPVHIDHCFARIILDATVGVDAPWPAKLRSPAYRNMTEPQLRAATALGAHILAGSADLVDLDNQSLILRGKKPKAPVETRKRKRGFNDEEASPGPAKRVATPPSPRSSPPKTAEVKPATPPDVDEDADADPDYGPWLEKIARSDQTPFARQVLALLCQVPRGRHTTYGALAAFLSSSPRAVGNALRRNPFAPQVPCHRVLATGGSLGGFKGSWGRKGAVGLNDDEKRALLRREGVRFDGAGRVVGSVWTGFV